MTNRRAKVAATATVLGLGALGGVAMATNQGLPAQVGGARTASVTTGASSTGATTVAASTTGSSHAPIVTRASGGAGGLAPVDD
jgi:hypothetical protein